MSLGTVLQGLLTTALGRAIPPIFQKIVRRGRVDAAMRGARSLHPALVAAMTDYEVVVGSTYGALTVSLDSFLRELEASGIAVAMAEEATLKVRSEETRLAFESLYRTVFAEAALDPGALYAQIATAFEASLEALTQDHSMALLIKAVSNDLARRLERIEHRISSAVVPPARFDGHVEIQQNIHKIARSLASQYKDIRIETNRGAKLVPIDRIYIPARLRPRQDALLPERLMAVPGSGAELRTADPDVDLDDAENDSVAFRFQEFKGGFRRAVVLGDPGGGKSTLCQYLCYYLVKQYVLSIQYPGRKSEEKEKGGIRVPLRLILRSFETARIRRPQQGIFDYLVADIRQHVTMPEDQCRECLSYLLTFGHAVLAFDGLDEIMNTGTRREFVDLVTNFADQYPLCPVFVTSRAVGYDDAPLPEDYEALVLEKFDDGEVTLYVTKFLKAFSKMKEDAAKSDAEKFIGQTDRDARDLRQNPLMLGLMTFLFANKGDVPTNRPEIYQECAMLMFEKWDQNRNIRADIPQDFDLLHLFGGIAAAIYGHPEREEGVDKRWLEVHCRAYFREIYEEKYRAFDAARKMSEFIGGRSWVMSEVGANQYRFTHRTFMEFFYARNLDQDCDTVDSLVVKLLPKILERKWDVISHLSLQMKVFRNQKRTSHAVDCLIKALAGHRSDVNHIAAVSRFSVVALGYLSPSELECRQLTRAIVKSAVRLAQLGEMNLCLSVLAGFDRVIAARRAFINECAADFFGELLDSDPKSQDFSLAAALLSGGGRSIMYRRNVPRISPQAIERVRNARKEHVRGLAERDPFVAQLYWEWYEQDFDTLLAQHGIRMLLDDRRPWPDGAVGAGGPILRLIPRSVQPRSIPPDPITEGERAQSRAILRSVGRWVSSKEIVEYRHGRRSAIMLSSDFWAKNIGSFKGDVDLMRGALLIGCLFDDGIRRILPISRLDQLSDNGDAPTKRARMTATQIYKAVASFLSVDDARFSFLFDDALRDRQD